MLFRLQCQSASELSVHFRRHGIDSARIIDWFGLFFSRAYDESTLYVFVWSEFASLELDQSGLWWQIISAYSMRHDDFFSYFSGPATDDSGSNTNDSGSLKAHFSHECERNAFHPFIDDVELEYELYRNISHIAWAKQSTMSTIKYSNCRHNYHRLLVIGMFYGIGCLTWRM